MPPGANESESELTTSIPSHLHSPSLFCFLTFSSHRKAQLPNNHRDLVQTKPTTRSPQATHPRRKALWFLSPGLLQWSPHPISLPRASAASIPSSEVLPQDLCDKACRSANRPWKELCTKTFSSLALDGLPAALTRGPRPNWQTKPFPPGGYSLRSHALPSMLFPEPWPCWSHWSCLLQLRSCCFRAPSLTLGTGPPFTFLSVGYFPLDFSIWFLFPLYFQDLTNAWCSVNTQEASANWMKASPN